MANVNFTYNSAGSNEKVYFETIVAEKAGGVIVAAPAADCPPATPIYVDSDGKYTTTAASNTLVGVSKNAIYTGEGDQVVGLVVIATLNKAAISEAVQSAIANFSTLILV